MGRVISLTNPIDSQSNKEGIEQDLAQAFKTVFHDQFGERIANMLDYGCAHLGDNSVIERFSKQDGLLVLRRNNTSNIIMRVLYANWLSQGGKRGLNYLEFALKMIWGDSFKITRLYHSIAYVERYPMFLTQLDSPDTFLTSRIFVKISKNIELSEVSGLSPMLRRLIPVHIVANVTSELLETNDEFKIGTALVGRSFNVMDF